MKLLIKFGIGVVLLSIIAGCTTPGINYNQPVTEVRSVPDISVQLSYIGGKFWHAKIKNNSNATAKLIWDESSYVNSKGNSTRLIRGITHKLDSVKAQPASPISPGALFAESFTSKSFVAEESAKFVGFSSTSQGRIYISFEVDGNEYKWEGFVVFTPVVNPQK